MNNKGTVYVPLLSQISELNFNCIATVVTAMNFFIHQALPESPLYSIKTFMFTNHVCLTESVYI